MRAASGAVVHRDLNGTNLTYLRHYMTKANHGKFQGRPASSRIEAV